MQGMCMMIQGFQGATWYNAQQVIVLRIIRNHAKVVVVMRRTGFVMMLSMQHLGPITLIQPMPEAYSDTMQAQIPIHRASLQHARTAATNIAHCQVVADENEETLPAPQIQHARRLQHWQCSPEVARIFQEALEGSTTEALAPAGFFIDLEAFITAYKDGNPPQHLQDINLGRVINTDTDGVGIAVACGWKDCKSTNKHNTGSGINLLLLSNFIDGVTAGDSDVEAEDAAALPVKRPFATRRLGDLTSKGPGLLKSYTPTATESAGQPSHGKAKPPSTPPPPHFLRQCKDATLPEHLHANGAIDKRGIGDQPYEGVSGHPARTNPLLGRSLLRPILPPRGRQGTPTGIPIPDSFQKTGHATGTTRSRPWNHHLVQPTSVMTAGHNSHSYTPRPSSNDEAAQPPLKVPKLESCSNETNNIQHGTTGVAEHTPGSLPLHAVDHVHVPPILTTLHGQQQQVPAPGKGGASSANEGNSFADLTGWTQKSFTSVLAKAHGIVSTFRDLDHDGLVDDIFAQFTYTDEDFYTTLTLVQPNGNKLVDALTLASSETTTSSSCDRVGRARLLLQAINDVSRTDIPDNGPNIPTSTALDGAPNLVVTSNDAIVAPQEPGSTVFCF